MNRMNNDKYRSLTESIRSMGKPRHNPPCKSCLNETSSAGWGPFGNPVGAPKTDPDDPFGTGGPKPYLGPTKEEIARWRRQQQCAAVRTFWEDMGCTPGCGGTDNPCDSACGTYETILNNLGCTSTQLSV